MNCPVCGDKGIVRVRYEDGSADDFGVCLCLTGLWLRRSLNAVDKPIAVPLSYVWAAREQVDPEQLHMVEDLLEPAELATIPRVTPTTQASAIAAAMTTAKRPRL